ncbi:MAG: gamma-glutamylcyclotransferase family protein [Planctomycetota bacterium]
MSDLSMVPQGHPAASRLRLFVFGTLRRGHRNHHFLEGKYASVVPAILHGYQRLHELMIAPAPGGFVDGELFELTPEIYDATLAGCDVLEEIPPGQLVGHEYERRLVSVETNKGSIQAWAYVQPTIE